MTDTFAGIKLDAPLWRGATLEQLTSICDSLQAASYHYADDSTKEWPKGHAALKQAAQDVNALGLDYHAIEQIYRAGSFLVAMGDLINAVLKDARAK